MPEKIAEHFVQFIRDNNLIIGAVNIYVQTYDEDMKSEKFERNADYQLFSPNDVAEQRYIEDVAQIRRRRMKKVVG